MHREKAQKGMNEIFLTELKKLAPRLTERQLEQCAAYYEALIRTNGQLNLTAITEPAPAAQKHFADSLAAADVLPPRAHVLDVGSGGGFPGVPLKIARPYVKMTLLDSVGKKTDAVRAMAASVGVDVVCVSGRAEELARAQGRGQFDAVVSRAVAALPMLMELCVPFLRVGGIFCAYKQKDAEDIAHAENARQTLHLAEKDRVEYGKNVVLVYEKTHKTPPEFPRRFAKIKKSPL